MALILADRVRENSNVQGTGDATLLGSPTGFETFAARIGDGNTTYYTIAEEQGDQWEVGVGTYVSSTNKLQRTTILASSNSGSVVSFGQGNKDVFVTLPAEKVVVSDAVGTMAYQNANAVAITGGAIDGTTIGSTTPAAATFTTITATSGSFQSAGANAGLVMLRNTDVSSSSTRIFLDSSGGTTSMYNGGNNIRFHTNATPGTSSGVEQFRVTATVSAVNFVQVTGAATGTRPAISVQGSDASINFDIVGKGLSRIFVLSNSARSAEFIYGNATSLSSNNWVKMIGNASGTAPVYGVEGTDTNIDLALTPKGTGLVRFGTYTAGAPTATGYISIKAANGTTYKVLVGT